MRRLWKLPTRCRQLAEDTRTVAGRRNVLYHGTRHPRSVLRMNTLFRSCAGGEERVPFTRSPEVAAHFALLDRDDDENTGAILIFDRTSLRSRCRLEPCHDPIWDKPDVHWDEMEERVWWRDIDDVRRHLLGGSHGWGDEEKLGTEERE
jgi:hypothetical protein